MIVTEVCSELSQTFKMELFAKNLFLQVTYLVDREKLLSEICCMKQLCDRSDTRTNMNNVWNNRLES